MLDAMQQTTQPAFEVSEDGKKVTVKYDKENPEQVTIESVEFEDNSVEIFVEEQELERQHVRTRHAPTT